MVFQVSEIPGKQFVWMILLQNLYIIKILNKKILFYNIFEVFQSHLKIYFVFQQSVYYVEINVLGYHSYYTLFHYKIEATCLLTSQN